MFLYGGNDYANTLTPYDAASHALYTNARLTLAYARASPTPTLLNPTTPLAGGRQYALGPAMASLMPVFDAGKMAAVLNVGTLVRPTTKAQYTANSVPLPPKLFSHNHQQSYWQASNPEGATSGWGGRLGDLFQSGNGNATLTCINATGNAVFLSARSAIQYAVGTNGPIALSANTSLFDRPPLRPRSSRSWAAPARICSKMSTLPSASARSISTPRSMARWAARRWRTSLYSPPAIAWPTS